VIAFASFATEGGESGDGGMGSSLKVLLLSAWKQIILHAVILLQIQANYQTSRKPPMLSAVSSGAPLNWGPKVD